MPRGPSRTAASASIPMASTGDSPILAGGFGSVSCGVIALFLWVLVQARVCLCPPRLGSLFPPVLWKSYNQIPLAFKVRFPGDSQSLCWIPRLGSLTEDLYKPRLQKNQRMHFMSQYLKRKKSSFRFWLNFKCLSTFEFTYCFEFTVFMFLQQICQLCFLHCNSVNASCHLIWKSLFTFVPNPRLPFWYINKIELSDGDETEI